MTDAPSPTSVHPPADRLNAEEVFRRAGAAAARWYVAKNGSGDGWFVSTDDACFLVKTSEEARALCFTEMGKAAAAQLMRPVADAAAIREALQPFADWIKHHDGLMNGTHNIPDSYKIGGDGPTLGQFRAAKAALLPDAGAKLLAAHEEQLFVLGREIEALRIDVIAADAATSAAEQEVAELKARIEELKRGQENGSHRCGVCGQNYFPRHGCTG